MFSMFINDSHLNLYYILLIGREKIGLLISNNDFINNKKY